MEKLKKIWCQGKNYWQKKTRVWRILFCSIMSGLVVLVYLGLVLLTIKPAILTLARLRESIGGACHEECQLARFAWRQELINDLKSGDKSLERKMMEYFLDQEEDLEFIEELIKVYSSVYSEDNLPDYLSGYLQNQSFSSELQVLIFNYFFAKNQVGEADLDYYLALLSDANNFQLKQAAIQAISNIEDQAALFTEQQIEIISELLETTNINNRLRQSLVLLLGDYYRFFPEKVGEILIAVYNSLNADKISQFFAADILNRYLLTTEFPEPFIGSAEWEVYYIEETPVLDGNKVDFSE